MMRRFRRGPRGRLPKPIRIEVTPNIRRFIPIPQLNPTPIYIEPAEIEALRLVDLEDLTQEAAAERMGISRGHRLEAPAERQEEDDTGYNRV